MNTQEAIEILTLHNTWRRGDDTKEPTKSTDLGNAIEIAIGVMDRASRSRQKMQKADLDGMKQNDLPPFTPVEYMLKAEGWDDAINAIKAKYGELYTIERE